MNGRDTRSISAAPTSTEMASPQRPLLFDCCRCSVAPGSLCPTCSGWHRHYGAVQQRRAAWEATR